MKLFRIDIKSRMVKAPSLYEYALKENEAVKQAKLRSRLSDFDEWSFDVIEIKR